MPRWIYACATLFLASGLVRAESSQTQKTTPSTRPRLEKESPSPDPSKYRDVQDSQGNRYKMDTDGNVFTNGTPNPKRQPASAENIIFYYNYGIDMMNKGYTAPALEVYREILALPPKNEMVVAAQKLARENFEQVRSFKDNAQKLDEMLFVVRHVEDGRVIYDNEKYRFRVRYPVNWKLEDEVRHDPDRGFASLSLYPLPLPAPNGGKVSMAIGFHADRLQKTLNVERYREQWVSRLEEQAGRNPDKLSALKRQPKASRAGLLRDRFALQMDGQPRAGEDAFLVKGSFAYYLTFTATPETYPPASEIFERFLSDFEVLP